MTVTGVDDVEVDGDITYSVILAAATSADTNYDSLDPDDVSLTNLDDDSAGVTVTPTSGLTTTEAGGTATFTVVLDTQPSADVAIALSSNDSSEGTALPASLTFTGGALGNWNVPQTVTVTGVDDVEVDGDITYSVSLAAAASTDTNYDSLDPDDVSLTNLDDDTAGVTVTPTSGLTTTEAGGTATFTVVLDTQPSADVAIALSSNDSGEGTALPASLTFTGGALGNWNVPQTVTVTGVDDVEVDGDITYSVSLAAAASTDTNYDSLDPDDVSLTNLDDDSAGVTVTPTSGLTTTEAGGTATFTVVLDTQPSADVAIALSSNDSGEGTALPASLTFTGGALGNWNVPQTVTVTGVDDVEVDGDITYSVSLAAAASTDTNYDSLDPDDVSLTNLDDDTAGVTVTPTSGLTTTEAGGTATFTVVLDTQPSADVSIALSSNDSGEGTALPASLTFTGGALGNWNVPQTVTVTGVDDVEVDGDITYSVSLAAAASTDTNYDSLDPDDVSLTNLDDDTAGVTVTPTSGLTTTEAGGTATFTVVLDTQPSADVSIALSSNDSSERHGAAGLTDLHRRCLRQLERAPDRDGHRCGRDVEVDGDITYSVSLAAATSTDTNYDSLDPDDVSLTNLDDDTAGVTVTPTSGLTTTEAGGTATFTVVLDTQPSADVAIALSSNDSGEGTALPASLTFTGGALGNWNVPQTVTVTGVDDVEVDGDITYSVSLAAATSTDTNYDSLDPDDVSLTNLDDDTAGVTVTPTSGLTTTEAGGTATFTVVLDTQPSADVAIALSSNDSGEGTALPASLTFTGGALGNWNVPQTVTVTGVDDVEVDGDITYSVSLAAAASTDTNYDSLDPDDVSLTNLDDDTAGVTVTPTSGLTTTEAGGTAHLHRGARHPAQRGCRHRAQQ